jgi:ABC-2 type transport system permease protein
MRSIDILVLEWKHFARSPFKVIALLLFFGASTYGLYNGQQLYLDQTREIENLTHKSQTATTETIAYFERGETGPKDRPWINFTTPFWAIWYTPSYWYKAPSPALVFSIGQTEQYSYYKNVTFWSSPYDSDMAEEIANPERLQMGSLDFAFVLLFLTPLLLLIFLHNVAGSEADMGILPVVRIQATSFHIWLLARIAFYALLTWVSLSALLLVGRLMLPDVSFQSGVLLRVFFLVTAYVLLWVLLFTLVLWKGKSSIGNTLNMVGIWLLLVLLLPATVHQWATIQYPVNLMTDIIDAKRDKASEIFDLPQDSLLARLFSQYPELENSSAALDSTKKTMAMNRSASALANQILKEAIEQVETENQLRNKFIQAGFWLNPVLFFQNKLNSLTGTHFLNYKAYRDTVQQAIDARIALLLSDTWSETEVDQTRYQEYIQLLQQPNHHQ